MFKIVQNSTHINIYINKKKISIRKGISQEKFYKSLKKYNYIFENIKPIESSNKYQNAIWILWMQGIENAPDIVKKCIESVKHFHPEKEIIILDYNNLKDYIQIPAYIEEKHKKGIIPAANFSDYIRLELLAKYGGTWIDATVLLTEKIPNNILEENFFIPQTPPDEYIEKLEYKELIGPPKKRKKPTKFLLASSWFIIAKPNNKIILAALQFFKEYWKKENTLKNYFMLHFFWIYSIENDEECKQIWKKMHLMYNHYTHLIQTQMKNEFNEEIFNTIQNLSFMHKLSYKHMEDNNKDWLARILNYKF